MIGVGLGLTQRAVLGGGSGAPAVTLLYDSFTEAGSVAVTAHTPDTVVAPASVPWQSGSASHFVVNTGQLRGGTLLANNRQAYINGGISDGIFSAGTVNTAAGLIFRHTDINNYWVLFNRRSGATNIELYEITANVLTTRGTYNVGSFAQRELQVIASGSSISCYIDGVLRISHTSTVHQSATGTGFRAESAIISGETVADEFRVIDSVLSGDLP